MSGNRIASKVRYFFCITNATPSIITAHLFWNRITKGSEGELMQRQHRLSHGEGDNPLDSGLNLPNILHDLSQSCEHLNLS